MSRIDEDFALVLEGLNRIEVDLAKGLLESAGIPAMAHGPDFDWIELGRAHDDVRGLDLYVPKDAYERAKEILDASWEPRPE